MEPIVFNSVEFWPVKNASATFVTTDQLFYETGEFAPIRITDNIRIMPWGADNQMPYKIIAKIEEDETMSTCQAFNSEICYGSGLQLNTENATPEVTDSVSQFVVNNDIPFLYMGQCQDIKHFGFAVTVLMLNRAGDRIVGMRRKEACNCRFTEAGAHGRISGIVYADWQHNDFTDKYEYIPLLNPSAPYADLIKRITNNTRDRKFAIVSRIPTVSSTYYPIPYYGSLFRGKWYDIKRLVGLAKYSKLKNAAPLKYQIEISARYWEQLFNSEGITDPKKKQERVKQEKENIINFLTGAENAGKALFCTFYVSPNGEEQHDVKITKISSEKEGGDWETDIQEAINIICFTMGVHSNLVGSVPGKSQSNNSGSDKRELYTIAQARQKPYHDLLFRPYKVAIAFNQWQGVTVECPFLMLTTLDQHTDALEVSPD